MKDKFCHSFAFFFFFLNHPFQFVIAKKLFVEPGTEVPRKYLYFFVQWLVWLKRWLFFNNSYCYLWSHDFKLEIVLGQSLFWKSVLFKTNGHIKLTDEDVDEIKVWTKFDQMNDLWKTKLFYLTSRWEHFEPMNLQSSCSFNYVGLEWLQVILLCNTLFIPLISVIH